MYPKICPPISQRFILDSLFWQEHPMLLLMIYENDTHKALINEATVPRVRHRAVEFKALSVTNSQQKVSLLGNKRNRDEVICCPVV